MKQVNFLSPYIDLNEIDPIPSVWVSMLNVGHYIYNFRLQKTYWTIYFAQTLCFENIYNPLVMLI